MTNTQCNILVISLLNYKNREYGLLVTYTFNLYITL